MATLGYLDILGLGAGRVYLGTYIFRCGDERRLGLQKNKTI